jgi:hypothetical protein
MPGSSLASCFTGSGPGTSFLLKKHPMVVYLPVLSSLLTRRRARMVPAGESMCSFKPELSNEYSI